VNFIAQRSILENKNRKKTYKDYDSAVYESLSTVGNFGNNLNSGFITVSSGEYPDQNVIDLNSLPPSLRDVLSQDDLDWFVYNLGNIISDSGRMISSTVASAGNQVSASGISDIIRNVFTTATSAITTLGASLLGNIANELFTFGGGLIGGVENWLSPSGDGGGQKLANAISDVFSFATDFIQNGLIKSVNSIFKGGINYFETTFPETANLFLGNVIVLLPELIQNSFGTLKDLATNAINDFRNGIFDVSKYLGGFTGTNLNITLPRIINVERRDIYCEWVEWWFFESDIGKTENQFNPLARVAKERLYKSLCYQTNVGTGGDEAPISPFGTYWLPSQIRSLINGVWITSYASRPSISRLPELTGGDVSCSFEDGKFVCKKRKEVL
jgi:hypothetical protein